MADPRASRGASPLQSVLRRKGTQVFLTFILTGVRRSERWGHVNLVERTLRVVESKSEDGERLIALPIFWRASSNGTTRRASTGWTTTTCSAIPRRARGWTASGSGRSARHARSWASKAGYRIHDLRHAALTNLAAEATPIVLMATAGHRSMQTTKQYLRPAGTTFAGDAQPLEVGLLGGRNF